VGLKVSGQSGKFTLYDKRVGEINPSGIAVQLDYLYEIASDGITKVGHTGTMKHSIDNFASQHFIIEDLIDTQIGDVNAQKISFHSSVNGIGKIQVDTFIATSNGTVGTDAEEWSIQPNDVKFNIVLSDWEFCDPCRTSPKHSASAEFIDVAVEIKGADIAAPKQKKAGGMSFDLGGGVPLELSNRVNSDGSWEVMPGGYPKIEEKSGKTLFVFRFPKFRQSATYDPVIGWSGKAAPAADPPITAAPSTAPTSRYETSSQPYSITSFAPSSAPSTSPSSAPSSHRYPTKGPATDASDSESPTKSPLVLVAAPSANPSSAPTAARTLQLSGAGGVHMQILGRSGKFSLSQAALGEEDPDKVTVQLDYLSEMSANGTTWVGKTGNAKHSIQTFANQDFIIDDPVNGTIGDVGALKVSFHSSVSSIGRIRFDTFVIDHGNIGTVGTDSERWPVRPGDVKFNIVLSEWMFCDPCGNGETSMYVDVALEIKGGGSAPRRRFNRTSTFDLGGSIPLELSNRVKVDRKWEAMPEGYPRVEEREGKTLFVFRFPKFIDEAVYDPIIGMSRAIGDINSTGEEDSTNSDTANNADNSSPPTPTIRGSMPSTVPTSQPSLSPSLVREDKATANDGSAKSCANAASANLIPYLIIIVLGVTLW